ncbi:MAG: HlyD family efflux transporter periplasmic adaptor subunit [Gemmiger sp.]|nr:HlyD family efflux transporter periplasmic adaptor subunit [Gemmiger sp.]
MQESNQPMAQQEETILPTTQAETQPAAQATAAGTPPNKKKPKKKLWFARHKLLTLLLAVVLVGVGVMAYRKFFAAKPAATTYQYVRTTTLQKTSLDNSVTVSGTVASGSVASVTVSDAAKNYKVSNVAVQVGDSVKSGDVICTLDTTDLEKSIASAKQSQSDALLSAQLAYTRAQDSYNTAVTQHDNNLLDLQSKIDQADITLTDAQKALSDAQSSYDKAKSSYDTIRSASDTAAAQIATFQNAYNAALTSQTNALNALNAAIANYQNSVAAYQAGTLDGANLVSGAQDMINAYHLYNGNVATSSGTAGATAAVSGSNTCDVAALTGQIVGYGVDAAIVNLNDVGTAYAESASGICDSALKSLTDAQNSVGNAALGYTNYGEIEKALATADTTLSAANQALETAKKAVTTAEQTVKTARDSYDNEKNSTALKTQKQSVEDAALKLQQAQRTPDTLTTLQNTLADCTLTATMSGTITALNATVGSVGTGTIATIQDTQGLTVTVTIPSDDVVNLTAGMRCLITSDATGDQEIAGTLTQIDPVANDKGTFGAKISVTGETGGKLLIGMQAKAQILETTTENVFAVPIDAVATAESGSSYVLRKTGGSGVDMTFEEVTVTTGTANDYYIEISGDTLAEGDVIRSSADLSEGLETADTRTSEEMAFGGQMGGTVTVTEAGEAPPDGGGGGHRGGDQ